MLYENVLDKNQKRAVRLAIRRKTCCIFFKQGVGKTHPTLSIIEELANDDFQGLLILPLVNIETTWIDGIKKYLPQIKYSRDWDDYKTMSSPKLFIVNYEGLKAVKKHIIKHKWTLAVADESQRLKARGSKQSRVAGLIKSAEYRVALSGTPIDGDPIDFFGQLRFAVPQLYGNDRSAWKRFDEEYLKPTGYMGYQRKFDVEKLNQFLDEIAPYILRVEKSSVHVPEPVFKKIGVDLLGDQDKLYQQMEDHFVAQLYEKAWKRAVAKAKKLSEETGEAYIRPKKVRITAGLKITQIIKLQQICSGFIVDDDGETHELDSSAKMRKLKTLLRRRTKLPVVIFCKYSFERLQIEKTLAEMGYSYDSIHGKVKDKKNDKARTRAIRKFQRGKTEALVCQIKAGGVGVDLFNGRTVIFYSNTFSFIDFEQAMARVVRRGQTCRVNVFFIFARNTIDEVIYSAILSKRSVSKLVFKHITRRLQNGEVRNRYQRKGQIGKENHCNQKRTQGATERIQVRRAGTGRKAWHRAGIRTRSAA